VPRSRTVYALLTAVAVAGIGILGIWFGARWERRHWLTEQRIAAYAAFMTIANRMAWARRFGEPVPTIEEINQAVARVTLLATSSVDDACQAWLDAVTAGADEERLMALDRAFAAAAKAELKLG
jgi:hypothetical protein